MNKKLIVCILMCFAVYVTHCNGQSIRLTHVWSRTDVTLDLNRVYNYNSYERNRWGAGLDIVQPLKYDTRYGRDFQNAFVGSVYAGYGTGDKAWKYGGAAGLRFPRAVFRSCALRYVHDLLRVGSHSFEDYNVFNTSENSSYFSSRYCGIDMIGAIVQLDIPGPGVLLLDYSHSRERYLFDASGLLYPSIYDDDAMPYLYYNEVGVDLLWGDHWKFGLLANINMENLTRNTEPGERLYALDYVRFLAQYSNKIKLKDNRGLLSLFAQGGIVSESAPLSRRFDLGGTGGGRYYFNNTFLTVRPNTFMADVFTLASIRYTTGRGLWKNRLSEPHPFVQLNAMWGMLYGKDITVQSCYINDKEISLTAPAQGLLEPCVGVDGLLHWGVLDMGVAAACQLTPENSLYHLDNFWDGFAVMFVAKLIL